VEGLVEVSGVVLGDGVRDADVVQLPAVAAFVGVHQFP
jgi:hypothetical protein